MLNHVVKYDFAYDIRFKAVIAVVYVVLAMYSGGNNSSEILFSFHFTDKRFQTDTLRRILSAQ
jgi:uncharacterized membrane protein YciS (DUF1049 family)